MTAVIRDALPEAAEASLNATQKVCAALRALAGRSPVALRALAEATELNKVTVFRILGTLAIEGFVQRPPGSRAYELGPGVAVAIRSPDGDALGSFSVLALSERIEARVQPPVQWLQEAARDTEGLIAVR